MKPFRIRELTSADTQALLAFEARNREWFESQIDAREPDFYSLQGVAEHIDCCLADFALGVWHPFVIEDCNARIVGRANLKGINSLEQTAEVGYRVDQNAGGQGLATLALEHLIEQAKERWGLTQLIAYVFKENLGSMKVLERCGFQLAQSSGDEPAEYRLVLSTQVADKH